MPDQRPTAHTTPVFHSNAGVWQHTVTTPYQRGPNVVEVLLPDDYHPSGRYAVLYVLPVEAADGTCFGDGLQVIRDAGLHNRHQLLCVSPAFDTTPWYNDNPLDPTIRHETYVRDVVVPLIDEHYATTPCSEGRLLLGFSKSGWGAYSLLLRNPEFFGAAASWDAPLMLKDWYWGYGMGQQFGSAENQDCYRPIGLLRAQAHHFRDRPRLVLMGRQVFGTEPGPPHCDGDHTRLAHELMSGLGIPHLYRNDLACEHLWHIDWVRPAIEALVSLKQV